MTQVFTINAGSSSLEIALDKESGSEKRQLSGEVSRVGEGTGRLRLVDTIGTRVTDWEEFLVDHGAALDAMRGCVKGRPPDLARDAVGRIFVAHLGNRASMVAMRRGVGLGTLDFSAGIGQHAASIRSRICEGLEYLGIRIDPGRNEAHAPVIPACGASVTVRILRTDEGLMIAGHTRKLSVKRRYQQAPVIRKESRSPAPRRLRGKSPEIRRSPWRTLIQIA